MTTKKVRINAELYDQLQNISEQLNVSTTQLMQDMLVDNLLLRGHEIKKKIKNNYLKRKETQRQQQLFFFKNAIKQLYLQCEWQYRMYAEVNIDCAMQTIKNTLERYENLDEEIKKELQQQKKHFQEYLNKKVFDERFQNIAVELHCEKWKKTKQIR